METPERYILGGKHAFWRIDRADRSRNATWARAEESKKRKKKKRNSEMWQVTYLPRPPTLCYHHQSCHVGWGLGRSQPCQDSSKSVKGFWLSEGSKSAIFLCLALWLGLYTPCPEKKVPLYFCLFDPAKNKVAPFFPDTVYNRLGIPPNLWYSSL